MIPEKRFLNQIQQVLARLMQPLWLLDTEGTVLLPEENRSKINLPEFMEPGKVYPVTIRTTKLSHTFRKGHQMRVTVTSSAKNFIFPNSNTRGGFNSQEIRRAHNCGHHGGQYRSAVTGMREK